jgi:hydroxyacylglutathione hydrolase
MSDARAGCADILQEHNVFMRVQDTDIQKLVGETEPVQVMKALREMKDRS